MKLRAMAIISLLLVAGCAAFPGSLLFDSGVPGPFSAVEAPIPPDAEALYDGVPQSMNAQGFPVLGDPDAPVQVVEYGSFDCPHCMVFHDTVMPALIERAAAGDISFTYVPIYGTGGVPNGLGAAEAALCAEQQGAFWPYHSALFLWQGQYGIEAFSADRLDAGAFNLGLDMAVWSECHQNMAVPKVLRSAAQSMRDAGVPGTPGLLVNGQLVNHSSVQAVNAAIDAALGAGQSAA